MGEQVGVEIISEGSVAVVAFKAASLSDAEELRAACNQIKEYIDENHPTRIVFDFEGVKFFSSQLLGLLLQVRAMLQSYGEVVISAINPQLHRVFKITNLDKVFKFFPDREEAIRVVEKD